ncbi:MAG: DUF4258 domain-containing protein [Rhodomicrobium sp.]
MPSEPNPLADVRDVSFTRHALFRMKDCGISEYDVYRGITSPSAAAKRDRKSGHYVFRVGSFRVVARKDAPDHATVITFYAQEEV